MDDEESIKDSLQLIADDYDIFLHHFSNWREAEAALNANFNDYSAIILDANCKADADSVEDEFFLMEALQAMSEIFGKKQEQKPWYILSAGTMDNFEKIVANANKRRTKFEEEWGNMLYRKFATNPDERSESLFANIQRVASEQLFNVVLSRHEDVFKYVGNGCLIDVRARRPLLQMLSALYFPEENIQFQFAANSLRQVLEYLYRAALGKGLLPDEAFKNGNMNLLDCSRFLSGKNTAHCGGARWGNPGKEKEGAGGDSILPKAEADMLKNILTFANEESHTTEVASVVKLLDKELFFGYVFHLCHIIKWFCRYVEQHPDVAANLRMHTRVEADASLDELQSLMKAYEGRVEVAERDDDGIIHIGECLLNIRTIPACQIKLRDIRPNKKEDTKGKYPFFAYYDEVK